MPIRRCGLRLTQPARRSQIEEALLSLELSWVHRARRPVGGLLLCQLTMLRQALTGGTAAGDHEKVPSGRPRRRASAKAREGRLVITGDNEARKGLTRRDFGFVYIVDYAQSLRASKVSRILRCTHGDYTTDTHGECLS